MENKTEKKIQIQIIIAYYLSCGNIISSNKLIHSRSIPLHAAKVAFTPRDTTLILWQLNSNVNMLRQGGGRSCGEIGEDD